MVPFLLWKRAPRARARNSTRNLTGLLIAILILVVLTEFSQTGLMLEVQLLEVQYFLLYSTGRKSRLGQHVGEKSLS